MEALQKIANLVRDPNVTIDATAFIVALAVSLAMSFALQIVYRLFFENRATGSQVHRAFIILGPSITALFIAIQYSLPLSLGLLGALSIIRFRTPIKEPEEVGFIMLLCACSVIIATFKFLLLLALIVAVTVGLAIRWYIARRTGAGEQDGMVLVSYRESDRDNMLPIVIRACEQRLSGGRLQSFSQRDGIATVHYSFRDLSPNDVSVLRETLSSREEVTDISLYFNKSGQLA